MKNTITQLFFEQFLQKRGIDDMHFWKFYLKKHKRGFNVDV